MILLWMPSGPETILIVVGILLLFGASRIPQMMRGIGQGVKEFKKALRDDEEPSVDKSDDEQDTKNSKT